MLTITQAAKLYNVTPRCVRLWIESGHLKASRFGKAWMVPPKQPRPADGRKRKP